MTHQIRGKRIIGHADGQRFYRQIRVTLFKKIHHGQRLIVRSISHDHFGCTQGNRGRFPELQIEATITIKRTGLLRIAKLQKGHLRGNLIEHGPHGTIQIHSPNDQYLLIGMAFSKLNGHGSGRLTIPEPQLIKNCEILCLYFLQDGPAALIGQISSLQPHFDDVGEAENVTCQLSMQRLHELGQLEPTEEIAGLRWCRQQVLKILWRKPFERMLPSQQLHFVFGKRAFRLVKQLRESSNRRNPWRDKTPAPGFTEQHKSLKQTASTYATRQDGHKSPQIKMSILNMVIGKVANDGIKNGLTPIQCVLLKCCHALVSCFSKTVRTDLENGRFSRVRTLQKRSRRSVHGIGKKARFSRLNLPQPAPSFQNQAGQFPLPQHISGPRLY